MRFLLFFFLCFNAVKIQAQELYSKAYGEIQNPAIIFIHGGPSGNANLFEGTTAKLLADKGFYVIVYDRRGEGRSKDEKATLTFEESFRDLLQIYRQYDLKRASLLAHSFGGIIATLFTEKYPEKVENLVLAGALFSQQETYDYICTQANLFYKEDTLKRNELIDIAKLDKHTAEYRKKCFAIASELKLFDMQNPTTESIGLRSAFEKSDFFKSSFRNQESPLKFFAHEKRSNTNTKTELKRIVAQNLPVIGIYGEDDGIFSKKQLQELREMIGQNHLEIIPNCSHFLFVDQQEVFLNILVEKMKTM